MRASSVKEKGRKKLKIKGSAYTPVLSNERNAQASSSIARTLHTTKLKFSGDGVLKVCNSRGISSVAVPNVPINDPRSTEEILESWLSPSREYGWDAAYVNSFIEKDIRPPNRDPEPGGKYPEGPGKGDTVLHEWTHEIDTYLRVMLTLEGRGEGDHQLSVSEDELTDSQRWNGSFFERSSLKALGVRIQLGHQPGQVCAIPEKAYNDDFVIIDCDMVHNVGLDYCGCGSTSKSQVEQLLERRLYPATIVNPKTAATFRSLELFEMLQYESKLTPYEFYNTLTRLTDNTGLHPVKDRYPALLRMVHEWRHTRLLKRSGKGHDPGGVESTKEGECALLCPPCPHPGINMPDGWEKEPQETRFIHSLSVGLDANYRLKRKDVSSDSADPGLSKGFAYFVNNQPFQKFVDQHSEDKEPKSTCSRHDAVNLADIRPGQGYAATGVATVECARHNMKRPGGVCDLQKGEKYSNMDYIFVNSFILFGLALLRTFLISYDIACQWSIHLMARIATINLQVPILHPDSETRFVVPKFHLPAHIPACQTKYAYMFTPGAGLGDGEAPERGWAVTNPLGPSVREMGPGTRRDTLDFHFGFYNWVHITELGNSLLKKMDRACSGVAERIISHREFEEALNPVDVEQWKKSVVEWERNPSSVPNPFDFTISAPSQTAIRKALSDEEAALLAAGKDFSLHRDISPSQLICRGLDLESEMRSLKDSMKQTWDHSRDRELTRVQLKSNAVVRKVDAWYQVLQIYIPSTVRLREESATSAKTVKPYDLPLWLPSQIGRRAVCPPELAMIEFRLRTAQAQDALTTIRRNLQRRVTVWDLKDRWLRGQGANTKALNLLSTLQGKIRVAKAEYTQARNALLTLGPLVGEKNVGKLFLKLEDSDIIPLSADSALAPSKGQTTEVKKSWIWKHPGASYDNVTVYEAETRKIEWAKSRARSHRYQEEIKLVKEEMNRTLRFFQWKEDQWHLRALSKEVDAREKGDPPPSPQHLEGLKAYSARQASICRGFRETFKQKWAGVPTMIATAETEVRNPKLLFARRAKERARIFSKSPQLSSTKTKTP
ncbi:hypothetical protein NMY22_g7930 [Coprinellus aureogranulatus]|nr:hypothetical protein NMY22_g7930 [Coprinellus aureogranulatus]